ncbi:MAG: ATP-dependent helicase, partial [Burkholderiaceae bacterium]
MSITPTAFLAPLLTPNGHLLTVLDSGASALPVPLQRHLTDAFAHGAGHGLLYLGATEVGNSLPPSWAWWRDFGQRYVTALCAVPEGGAVATPDEQLLDSLVAAIPPMKGAEYLT